MYYALQLKKMTSHMMVELLYAITFWIHAFPEIDGVSATISPREIVTGVTISAGRHFVIPFGAYVQTHEPHDKSMESKTTGAIALRPIGNAQGGHYFFNSQIGRRISRNHWTEIPMPIEVIEWVNLMTESSATNRLIFSNINNAKIHDDEIRAHSDSDSQEESGADTSTDNDSDDIDNSDRGHDANVLRRDERAVTDDDNDYAEGQELQQAAVIKKEQEKEWLPYDEPELGVNDYEGANEDEGGEVGEVNIGHAPSLVGEAQATGGGIK